MIKQTFVTNSLCHKNLSWKKRVVHDRHIFRASVFGTRLDVGSLNGSRLANIFEKRLEMTFVVIWPKRNHD